MRPGPGQCCGGEEQSRVITEVPGMGGMWNTPLITGRKLSVVWDKVIDGGPSRGYVGLYCF